MKIKRKKNKEDNDKMLKDFEKFSTELISLANKIYKNKKK